MDRAGIERVLALAHTQESSRLFECLRPQTGDLAQSLAAWEGAVLLAVGHKFLGQLWADPGDIGQQRGRGGVDIHPHLVDHALHHTLQRRSKLLLVHIVLVQTDANGFGVDLDQLGQRILSAAGDRDRPAQADVQVGQLERAPAGWRCIRSPRLR